MKRYNHAGLAGCVEIRRARSTGTRVGVYHAEQAAIDPSGGRWVTVCETHSTLCNHDTLALARLHRSDPAGWCEDCREAASPTAPCAAGSAVGDATSHDTRTRTPSWRRRPGSADRRGGPPPSPPAGDTASQKKGGRNMKIRIKSHLAGLSRGRMSAKSENTGAWLTPRGSASAVVEVDVGDRIMVNDTDGFRRGGTAYYKITEEGPVPDGHGKGRCRVDVSKETDK